MQLLTPVSAYQASLPPPIKKQKKCWDFIINLFKWIFCCFSFKTDPQHKADFFSGGQIPRRRGDCSGMTQIEILSLSNQELEQRHNFIQWLFPLKKASKSQPLAPITTDKAIALCSRQNPDFKARMRANFILMIRFYGGSFSQKTKQSPITLNRIKKIAEMHWLTENNHNYLRITRIITSLKIHGLTNEATLFHRFIKNIATEKNRLAPGTVSDRTLRIWEHAAPK